MDEFSLRMAAGHSPQTAAKFIKDSMEKKYGPTWHVMCGEGFGFNVTYEQKHCL
jgi:dynein light chain 4